MKPAVRSKLSVSEKEFWNIYFSIQNTYMENKLKDQEVKLAAAICAKPLNFYLDTRKAPTTRSRYVELGEELQISAKSKYVYKLIEGLQTKGILTKSTDGFLDFSEKVRTLRRAIKQGTVEFDYIFEFNLI